MASAPTLAAPEMALARQPVRATLLPSRRLLAKKRPRVARASAVQEEEEVALERTAEVVAVAREEALVVPVVLRLTPLMLALTTPSATSRV